MHPNAGREVGWEQVRASFDGVGKMDTGGHVELAMLELQGRLSKKA